MKEKHFIITLTEEFTVGKTSGKLNRNSNSTQWLDVELDGWKLNEGDALYVELSHYDDDTELTTNVGPLQLFFNTELERYVTLAPPELICVPGRWNYSIEQRFNISEDENGEIKYNSLTSAPYSLSVIDSIISVTQANSFVKETELLAAARVLGDAITAGNTADEIIAKAKELAVSSSLEATAPHVLSAAQSASEASELLEQTQEQASAAEQRAQAALNSEQAAADWAAVAKSFAEYGIKTNFKYPSLDELPRPGSARYLYFIPNGSEGNNSFDEYIWAEDKEDYEKLGTTNIDLTAYLPKKEAADTYETKVAAQQALAEKVDNETFETELEKKADVDGTYPDLTAGQADKVENALTLKVNGEEQAVFDGSEEKEVNVTIPTKTSDLTNDSLVSLTANQAIIGSKQFNNSVSFSSQIYLYDATVAKNVQTGRILPIGKNNNHYIFSRTSTGSVLISNDDISSLYLLYEIELYTSSNLTKWVISGEQIMTLISSSRCLYLNTNSATCRLYFYSEDVDDVDGNYAYTAYYVSISSISSGTTVRMRAIL